MEITDPIGLTDRAVVKIKPQCLALSIDLTFHNYDYFKWADRAHRRRSLSAGKCAEDTVQQTMGGSAAGSIWKPLTRSCNQSRGAIFATWVKCARSCDMAFASAVLGRMRGGGWLSGRSLSDECLEP